MGAKWHKECFVCDVSLEVGLADGRAAATSLATCSFQRTASRTVRRAGTARVPDIDAPLQRTQLKVDTETGETVSDFEASVEAASSASIPTMASLSSILRMMIVALKPHNGR